MNNFCHGLTTLSNEFLRFYEGRPVKVNSDGLQCESSFVLWWVLKSLPELTHVIECGVAHGASSWLLEKTRPDVAIIHSDPILKGDLKFLWHKTQRGLYTPVDFLSKEFPSSFAGPTTLAFFDDHQDVLPRLELCLERGIRHVLFDDNWRDQSDHASLWQYQSASPKVTSMNRFTAVAEHILEQVEFRSVRHLGGLFVSQVAHQNMTYLQLRGKI